MKTINKIEETVKKLHDAYTVKSNPNVKLHQVNSAVTTINEYTERLKQLLTLYEAEQALKNYHGANNAKKSNTRS